MKSIYIKLFALALLCFQTLSGQNLPKPEEEILRSLEHNISYLADDHLEGRLVGSRGEKLAYEFIIENFQTINLLPKGEQGFIQAFTLNKVALKSSLLALDNKVGKQIFDKVNQARNYPLPFSKPGQVEEKCIWAGYGIEATELNYNDYALLKSVKGKIVVVKMGHPEIDNPHSKFGTYATLEAKVDLAISKGAAGVIVINTNATILEPDFKPLVKAPFKSVPVYFLGKEANLDSINFVNTKAKIVVDTMSIAMQGHNVIGYINNKSKNTIVIGAHYDHLGYNELGGSTYRKRQNEKPQIHNGADDNASGTAALMEMAELLQKSPYREQNYLFIAFSGEEEGLLGSRYFVEHPTINLNQINYMLNMDMVGRIDTTKNMMSLSGTGTSPRWDSILPSIEIPNLKVKYDPSGTGASDHTSFYNLGIPVLHFFSGQHSDYHKPSDDWELINFKGTLSILKYMYAIVGKLDKQPKLTFTKTKETQSRSGSFKVTLGIMPDYLYEGKGVKVDGTSDGKPGAVAGVIRGDIIIQLNAYPIHSMDDYMQTLGTLEKGSKSKLKLLRGGKELELEVQF